MVAVKGWAPMASGNGADITAWGGIKMEEDNQQWVFTVVGD